MSCRTPIFESSSKDVHVCHGKLTRKPLGVYFKGHEDVRFIATAASMESASHDMRLVLLSLSLKRERLKKSQYRKYEPVRRSLLMTALHLEGS